MANNKKTQPKDLPAGFGRLFRDIATQVKALSDDDRLWVKERTELLFGGDFVVSRSEVHDPHKLAGYIATEGSERVGLITYDIVGDACEVVTIDALCQYIGVGTLLLEKVENIAREADCTRLWTITTNDRIDAQRFFQKRGFVISEVRLGAMTKIRLLKPSVPKIGDYGLPVRDEIEFEKILPEVPGS
ncbi:MAG: N-acetylglutamate synthase-like GNAT family acetyltransferase [Candidatus Krumholzibacteriia bacterium]|jgi:N-acetylglutamate synthase-like GNAT family acetyltransferase